MSQSPHTQRVASLDASSSSSSSTVIAPVTPGSGSSRSRSLSKHDISQLSASEKASLAQMREKLKSRDPEKEYEHLRFLRARKFVVDDAVAQYRRYLQWRIDARIDRLLLEPPVALRKVLSRIVPEAFHKFDRFGMPAYYMLAGRVNPSLLLKYVTVEDMLRTHLWGQEYSFQRAAEKSKELRRNIDQFVNVVDMQGLTMSHRSCLKYLRAVAALDQQYYPESLGKTYIINAPWIFPALWALIRPFLDPVTVSKIHVVGSDYQAVLKDRFELDSLPAEYGGTCRCEGGCIPVYTEEQAEQVVSEYESALHMKEITLAPSQSAPLTFNVTDKGASFAYYFRSFHSEIGFTSFFTKQSDRSIITWQKHDKFASGQPWKGKFTVECAGTASFVFDNNHSWMHTETMKYSIEQGEVDLGGIGDIVREDERHEDVPVEVAAAATTPTDAT